jgi:hypothetical protein
MQGDHKALYKAASKSLLQIQTGAVDGEPLYVVFNIWAEEVPHHLRIPESILNRMKVTSSLKTTYFLTPAKAFTEIHHGLLTLLSSGHLLMA